MHHLHISTPFLFILSFFVVAIVAVILSYIRTVRRDRQEAKIAEEELKLRAAFAAKTNEAYPPAKRYEEPSASEVDSFMSTGRTVPPRSYGGGYVPNSAAPVVNHQHTYAPAVAAGGNDAMLGLTTGMLLGSALGHSHSHGGTTIINNDSGHTHSTSSYSDSYSSPSYSSSSDSGFSYSDSSSSYDSGSSGGFDASF
jgi:hypothetical protein